MNVKKNWKNQIRGWLPQEPLVRSQGAANRIKPTHLRTVFQNVIFGLVIAFGLVCSVFVLSNSWIKLLVIGVTMVGGIAYLLLHGKLRSVIKYTAVSAMIFALCFTAFESYVFRNAGYPVTFAAAEPETSLSVQRMLNTSVLEIVQGIEQSPAFNLVKLEYGEYITFESMSLMPSNGHGGYVSVDFASKDNNAYCHFYSSNGHQYIVKPMTHIGQLMSQKYSSKQTIQESLGQIDVLGLNWFYNRALEIAQNRTANLPSIDSLDISITFGEGVGNYQGITLQLIGYHQTAEPNGNIHGEGVLISEFQPDGTLIYMSKPTQE